MTGITEDVEALNEAKSVVREAPSKPADDKGFTRADRYVFSLRKLTEIAKQKDGDKITIHIIGVGGEDSPQVTETIEAMKKTGKKIELHLMDINEKWLKRVTEKIRKRFPEVVVGSHHIDILSPDVLPINKADITVCTNVLIHSNPWVHSALGLHHLSSMMKKDGHALVDDSALAGTLFQLNEFGFSVKEKIKENQPEWQGTGVIIKKTGEPIPFHRVWNRIKVTHQKF